MAQGVDVIPESNEEISEDGHKLMEACSKGETIQVKTLLSNGVPVNLKNSDKEFPLLLASKNGYTETVKVLLDQGAQVDLQDNNGRSALSAASGNGHTETVKVLLDHGAQVNLQANNNITLPLSTLFNLPDNRISALMIASLKGHTETVKVLLDYGAQVTEILIFMLVYSCALPNLFEFNTEEMLTLLLDHDAYYDINLQAKYGVSALMIASLFGSTKCVRILLNHGAKVNLINDFGESCLNNAIYSYGLPKLLANLDNTTVSAMQDIKLDNMIECIKCLSSLKPTGQIKETFDLEKLPLIPVPAGEHTSLPLSSNFFHDIAELLLPPGEHTLPINSNFFHIAKLLLPAVTQSHEGHTELIEILLTHGADVNLQSMNGISPLMTAIYIEKPSIFKLLLKHGAQVDLTTVDGISSLMTASCYGQTEMVRILLDHDAQVDLTMYNNGMSSLMIATCCGQTEIVRLLLDYGAQVNLQSKNGLPPLMIAIRYKQTEIAQLLLENGAQVDMQIFNGLSPLMLAIVSFELDMINLLLKHGAQIDLQDNNGVSALVLASVFGKPRNIELLLKHGAHVDLQNNHALLAAIISRGIQEHSFNFENGTLLSDMLQDVKIDRSIQELMQIFVQDKDANNDILAEVFSPLIPAEVDAKKPMVPLFRDTIKSLPSTNIYLNNHGIYTETIKILLDHGTQVNLQGIHGVSPLMIATYVKQTEIVNMLLEHGALVDLTDNDGVFSLMLASDNGHTEMVKLLLDRGAPVDLQAKDGASALIIASLNGHTEAVKILIGYDAQVNLQQDNGLSALMNASWNGHAEIVKILLEHGAQVDLQAENGYSALMLAISHGDSETPPAKVNQVVLEETIIASNVSNIETVNVLLEHGANVNLKTSHEISALIMACHEGQAEIVEILLAHGSQIDQSAIITAQLNNHERICNLLKKKENTELAILKDTITHTDVQIISEPQENKIMREVEKRIIKQMKVHKKQIEVMCSTMQETIIQKSVEKIIETLQSTMQQAIIDRSVAQVKAQFEKEMQSSIQQTSTLTMFMPQQATAHPQGKELSLNKVFRELWSLAVEWENIGALLGIPDDELEVIEHDYNKARDRLREMIKRWLKMVDPEPSWEGLVEAVEIIDKAKAQEIKSKYI